MPHRGSRNNLTGPQHLQNYHHHRKPDWQNSEKARINRHNSIKARNAEFYIEQLLIKGNHMSNLDNDVYTQQSCSPCIRTNFAERYPRLRKFLPCDSVLNGAEWEESVCKLQIAEYRSAAEIFRHPWQPSVIELLQNEYWYISSIGRMDLVIIDSKNDRLIKELVLI